MRNKYYLLALLIVAIDHVTKWIVSARLPDRPIELIPGYLRFSYVSNTGVAFGFFNGNNSVWQPYVLGAMAVAALVAIFLYGRRVSASRVLLQCALAIIMGGILGNFVDRVFRGYVVDFIEFHIHESFYWPNFNVADSAIAIGIALLLIDTIGNPGMNEVAEPTADRS